MIRGTKNIAVCLPQAMGVMNVLGAIVTTECEIGGKIKGEGEIGVVTDEEMIAGITGHVIAGHQKIAADLIAHSGMSKGITKRVRKDITKNVTKGVATIAPTPNEGMIGDTVRKNHHKHQAIMRPEAIQQKYRSTACLSKLKVTCDVVTPD